MKIAVVGYGRMGRAVEAAAAEADHAVVARLGRTDARPGGGFEADAFAGADVVVDFSVAEAVPGTVRSAVGAGLPVVVGTTGWTERLSDVERTVQEAGGGLLHAPNFSLGVHLFFRLARQAARLADALPEYDVHVLEAHHRHKRDHPSGTARHLAELVLEGVRRKARWREGPGEGTPDPSELQVAVIRAGEIPGTHVLALDGPDDRVELAHQARSRAGFARGAVRAAEWLRGRAGVFTVDDWLAELWEGAPGEP